jgi:cell division protein FtsX
VHADGDPLGLLPSVRAAVRALDPELPLFDARTLVQQLDQSLGRRRIATWLIGVFASLALALVGVYGVMSYDVSQRQREIGIRMALGADRRAVLVLVLRGGARMAALGVCAGAALALTLARLAGGLLFGVSAHDPPTYAALATRSAELAIGNQQFSLPAVARVVGIGLSVGMTRRGVTAAPRMRLAGAVRQAGTQTDLALANLLEQVRDEQRRRQCDRYDHAYLNRRHTSPRQVYRATFVPRRRWQPT